MLVFSLFEKIYEQGSLKRCTLYM